jgi:hypothetical protein
LRGKTASRCGDVPCSKERLIQHFGM